MAEYRTNSLGSLATFLACLKGFSIFCTARCYRRPKHNRRQYDSPPIMEYSRKSYRFFIRLGVY